MPVTDVCMWWYFITKDSTVNKLQPWEISRGVSAIQRPSITCMLLGAKLDSWISSPTLLTKALPALQIGRFLLLDYPREVMEETQGGTGKQSWQGPNSSPLVVGLLGWTPWLLELKNTWAGLHSFSVDFRRMYLTFPQGFHNSALTPSKDFLKYLIIWGSAIHEHACVSARSVAVHFFCTELTFWLWGPEFALLSSPSLKQNNGFEVKFSKNLS